MLVVKYDLLSVLKIPISQSLFGKNKTYRGILFVTLASGFFVWLVNNSQVSELGSNFMLGCLLGLSYVIMELPNSFVKRRLGIKAGESSEQYKILSVVMDKSDSTLGVAICFGYFAQLSILSIAALFFFAFTTHLIVSYVLVKLNIKKSL